MTPHTHKQLLQDLAAAGGEIWKDENGFIHDYGEDAVSSALMNGYVYEDMDGQWGMRESLCLTDQGRRLMGLAALPQGAFSRLWSALTDLIKARDHGLHR